MGGAVDVRESIAKTSSGKNGAVVLWEYSYNERGNQIFRKLSFLLKQYWLAPRIKQQ